MDFHLFPIKLWHQSLLQNRSHISDKKWTNIKNLSSFFGILCYCTSDHPLCHIKNCQLQNLFVIFCGIPFICVNKSDVIYIKNWCINTRIHSHLLISMQMVKFSPNLSIKMITAIKHFPFCVSIVFLSFLCINVGVFCWEIEYVSNRISDYC